MFCLAPPPRPQVTNLCNPSPCGTNANCRVEGTYAVCECIPNYQGNPYERCRPECTGNSECPMNRACINQKCRDPCPGTCGIDAICNIVNHAPMCSCPHGMTGNAFTQCVYQETKKPPVQAHDPCYPSPCGENTICRVENSNAVCECVHGYFGNVFTGCRPECTINEDCSRDRVCVNQKCTDPCPSVCGYNALCNTINHSPICSCPNKMVGDPFVQCTVVRDKEPNNPCQPSPCGPNGICRNINGVASCTYPECVTNSDCARDRACYNQKCQDPCINACGLNALCNTINHKAICSCPPNYMGSPFVECQPQIEVIVRPECIADHECSSDKTCINEKCRDPCAESGVCGHNSECRTQNHRPVCVCRSGFTGNAHFACYEIGCRSDSECPSTQACINKDCVDPCAIIQCGLNAVCKSDYNHRGRCVCLDNFRGNPLVQCTQPECTRDEQCPFHLACRKEKCSDPCDCAPGAQCKVFNHVAQCRCPQGYRGNGRDLCEISEFF